MYWLHINIIHTYIQNIPERLAYLTNLAGLYFTRDLNKETKIKIPYTKNIRIKE